MTPSPSRRRLAQTLLGTAALLSVGFAGHLLVPYFRDGHLDDLEVYRHAILLLSPANSQLYEYHSPIGDTFNYPPFAAIVLWPLAHVPSTVAAVWITVCTVLAFTAAGAGLVRRNLRATVAGVLAGATIGLVSAPLQSDLRTGQVSVLLAVLVGADVLLDWRGARYAGVLLGLACAIKLTPLVFVALLFLAGRRRTAVIAGASFIAATAVSWLLLPTPSMTYWTHHAWQSSKIPGVWDPANQSILGCLHRLGITGGAATLVWGIGGIIVFAFGAHTTRTLYRQGAVISATAVMGAVSLLISPVSWTHHQTWLLLFPALLLEGRVRTRRAAAAGTVLAAVSWFNVGAVIQLVPGLDFIGENFRLLLDLAAVLLGARIHRAPALSGPTSATRVKPDSQDDRQLQQIPDVSVSRA